MSILEKHVDFVNISTDELDVRNNMIDYANKPADSALPWFMKFC